MSTLQDLRERPREEKNAIAAWVALAVVAILFIGWLIYFFQEIAGVSVSVQTQQTTASSTPSNSIDRGQQALDQMNANSNGSQLQNTIQVEEVGSTSTQPGM